MIDVLANLFWVIAIGGVGFAIGHVVGCLRTYEDVRSQCRAEVDAMFVEARAIAEREWVERDMKRKNEARPVLP